MMAANPNEGDISCRFGNGSDQRFQHLKDNMSATACNNSLQISGELQAAKESLSGDSNQHMPSMERRAIQDVSSPASNEQQSDSDGSQSASSSDSEEETERSQDPIASTPASPDEPAREDENNSCVDEERSSEGIASPNAGDGEEFRKVATSDVGGDSHDAGAGEKSIGVGTSDDDEANGSQQVTTSETSVDGGGEPTGEKASKDADSDGASSKTPEPNVNGLATDPDAGESAACDPSHASSETQRQADLNNHAEEAATAAESAASEEPDQVEEGSAHAGQDSGEAASQSDPKTVAEDAGPEGQGEQDDSDMLETNDQGDGSQSLRRDDSREPVVLGTVESTDNSSRNKVTQWVLGPDGDLMQTTDANGQMGAEGAPDEASWSGQPPMPVLSMTELLCHWQSGPCPVYNCRSKGSYSQQYLRKRHYETHHTAYHMMYVCPAAPCPGINDAFKTTELKSLILHLKSKRHTISNKEIETIRASIVLQKVYNPNYIPPVYNPVSGAPENAPEEPGANLAAQVGFMQVEELRPHDGTSEDVSDFLHIPDEAVEAWRATKKCPVLNCKGPPMTLKHFFDWHWYVFHEHYNKVYYCPQEGCEPSGERWHTLRRRDLVSHLTSKHEVEELPEAIQTQIIRNTNYKTPNLDGNMVQSYEEESAPVPVNEPPIHLNDTTVLGEVQTRVISEPEDQSQPEPQSQPQPQPSPPETEIPEHLVEAWQDRKSCPCEGCSQTNLPFMSEFKRHWEKTHVRTLKFYFCPDDVCQKRSGRSAQFRTRDLKAMRRHLIGEKHCLSAEEADQIIQVTGATLLENPSYIEPQLAETQSAGGKARSRRRGGSDVPSPTPPKRRRGRPRLQEEKEEEEEDNDEKEEEEVSQEEEEQKNETQDEPVKTPQKRGRKRTSEVKPDEPENPERSSRRKKTEKDDNEKESPSEELSEAELAALREAEEFEEKMEEHIPAQYLKGWSRGDGCPSQSCQATKVKYSIKDLVRHWKTTHLAVVPFYFCSENACDFSSKYRSSLGQHLERKHKIRGAKLSTYLETPRVIFADNPDYSKPVSPAKKSKRTPEKPKVTNTPTPSRQSRRKTEEIVAEEPAQASDSPPQASRKTRSGRQAVEEPVSPRPAKKSRRDTASVSTESPSQPARATRSGKPIVEQELPVSKRRTRSSGGDEQPEETVPADSPSVPPRSRRGRTGSQSSSMEVSVALELLPKIANKTTVDLSEPAYRSILDRKVASPQPACKSPGRSRSPVKVGTRSSRRLANPDMHVSFDLDEETEDDMNVSVPLPSLEDAGIAISVLAPVGSAKGKSPAKISSPLKEGTLQEQVQGLLQRQQQMEERIAAMPSVNSEVLKQISELQTKNEALRFQNQALRNQLQGSGAGTKWEQEKEQLLQQLAAKDVTISTLQDVVSKFVQQKEGQSTAPATSTPGRKRKGTAAADVVLPQTAASGGGGGGGGDEEKLQNCTVTLKSGVSVEFQYNSFGDFMHKIGTLNDQYGLNH